MKLGDFIHPKTNKHRIVCCGIAWKSQVFLCIMQVYFFVFNAHYGTLIMIPFTFWMALYAFNAWEYVCDEHLLEQLDAL